MILVICTWLEVVNKGDL